MKIKAYQIPPEDQTSPLFWDDSSFEEIQLFGNKQYNERTTDQFRNIPGMLDEIAEELFYLMQGQKYYTDFSTILEAYTGRADYTRAERMLWVHCIKQWTKTDEEISVFLDVLYLLTGKKHRFATLWGSCQGDWQNIIYPAEYGAEWLRAFEIEYFNLGTEWQVHENDENSFSIYCINDPRAEIADAVGVDPGDVILYEFDGWTRSPKYKEVQA